jgi:hypothetical protein
MLERLWSETSRYLLPRKDRDRDGPRHDRVHEPVSTQRVAAHVKAVPGQCQRRTLVARTAVAHITVVQAETSTHVRSTFEVEPLDLVPRGFFVTAIGFVVCVGVRFVARGGRYVGFKG